MTARCCWRSANRVAVVDQFVLPIAIVREVIARLPTSMFVNEERPLGGSILALEPSGQPLGPDRSVAGADHGRPTW